MSQVTDVILVLSVIDDEAEGPIQKHLKSTYNGASLTRLDMSAGGNKGMQAAVWLGAFNYLYMDELEKEFASMPLEFPECAQLMLKGEDWARFKVIERE